MPSQFELILVGNSSERRLVPIRVVGGPPDSVTRRNTVKKTRLGVVGELAGRNASLLPPIAAACIYWQPELLALLHKTFPIALLFWLNLAFLKLKYDWLWTTLGAHWIAVTRSTKDRENHLATVPSKESEYGTSITETNQWLRGIRTRDLGNRYPGWGFPLGRLTHCAIALLV